jgi:hypothetical protein
VGVPTEMPSVLARRRGRPWCSVLLHRARAGRPEDLSPQPLGSRRWTCSLCRRSDSGSSMRSFFPHHDVDASHQWRSHPIGDRMGCTADRRSSLARDTAIPASRPRRRLWARRPATARRHGHPRSAHCPSAASGATKASPPKPATSSRRSTAASPKCFDTPDLKQAKALLEELTKAPVVLCRSQR